VNYKLKPNILLVSNDVNPNFAAHAYISTARRRGLGLLVTCWIN